MSAQEKLIGTCVLDGKGGDVTYPLMAIFTLFLFY